MRIAILGTRGVPANYGGFETFAEELSARLVERGHEVTVYGRSHYIDRRLGEHRGVRLRVLPSIRHKYLETVSHTVLSVGSALFQSFDVVLICNAANAFASWIPRVSGSRVILNVDGIERERRKWNRFGRIYYRLGERLATLLPNCIVSDAAAIQRYYLRRYGCPSRLISYGASTDRQESVAELERLGVEPGRYLLYVSRLEPENNAHLVLEAYRRCGVQLPLVLVGDAPYSQRYIDGLRCRAQGGNVIMPGAVFGVGYRELISHSLCYFQATEVGGTHPALIESMGVGALVIANDTPENREVVAEAGILLRFGETELLAEMIRQVCGNPERFHHLRQRARERVRLEYDWEKVTTQYEELFDELVDGLPSTGSDRHSG